MVDVSVSVNNVYPAKVDNFVKEVSLNVTSEKIRFENISSKKGGYQKLSRFINSPSLTGVFLPPTSDPFQHHVPSSTPSDEKVF